MTTAPEPRLSDAETLTPSTPTRGVRARYYSDANHALSPEDRHSLAIGEKNHNLRPWTKENVVQYYNSRSDYLHGGPRDEDQVSELQPRDRRKAGDRMSMRESTKSIHGYAPEPKRSITLPAISTSVWPTPTYVQTPSAPLRPVSHHLQPPPTPGASDYFSIPTPVHRRTGFRNSSLPRAPRPLRHSGRPSTSYSTPPSPLGKEIRDHQVRSDVTFDTFLAPHKSGKGEVPQGSTNAKKEKEETAEWSEPWERLKKKASFSRRNASTPNLASEQGTWKRLSTMRSNMSLRSQAVGGDPNSPQMSKKPSFLNIRGRKENRDKKKEVPRSA